MHILKSIALCAVITLVSAAPESDFVESLPLYGPPPTPMYSGFLNATSTKLNHRWAPTVLWLNGGPGSTSMLGMLQENGPLLINATGGLMDNPYAWTKYANMLYLESPSGVGFSYCHLSSVPDSDCKNTDVTTARDARIALQDFFTNKFPELRGNEFFITGESYVFFFKYFSKIHVPTLAREILDNAPEINLKGVAVGDPCTDNKAQQDSMDMLWYAHKHGFVPDFDLLWNKCRARHPPPLVLGTVKGKGNADSRGRMQMSVWSEECLIAKRKYMLQSSMAFSQVWDHAWINNLSLYGPGSPGDVSFDQPGSLNYMTLQFMYVFISISNFCFRTKV
eukprot:GSMAST32.ASY1.ANO1.947.1 assembled CDS